MNRVKDFLHQHDVPFQTISHVPTYTAQGTAAATHIRGRNIAKTVILKCDDQPVMVVLPAPFRVDLDHIQETLGVKKVEMMPEQELRELFPDCELGAMPPFGNLYDMDVVSDLSLAHDVHIAFNAGTHNELIRMTFHDFDHCVKPRFAACRA